MPRAAVSLACVLAALIALPGAAAGHDNDPFGPQDGHAHSTDPAGAVEEDDGASPVLAGATALALVLTAGGIVALRRRRPGSM